MLWWEPREPRRELEASRAEWRRLCRRWLLEGRWLLRWEWRVGRESIAKHSSKLWWKLSGWWRLLHNWLLSYRLRRSWFRCSIRERSKDAVDILRWCSRSLIRRSRLGCLLDRRGCLLSIACVMRT